MLYKNPIYQFWGPFIPAACRFCQRQSSGILLTFARVSDHPGCQKSEMLVPCGASAGVGLMHPTVVRSPRASDDPAAVELVQRCCSSCGVGSNFSVFLSSVPASGPTADHLKTLLLENSRLGTALEPLRGTASLHTSGFRRGNDGRLKLQGFAGPQRPVSGQVARREVGSIPAGGRVLRHRCEGMKLRCAPPPHPHLKEAEGPERDLRNCGLGTAAL
ncbi:hypothetical protein AGIG_G9706 [Arapaima gigas]